MKKVFQIAAVALLTFCSTTFVSAQKYGYANYEYIIQSMPDIKAMNSELTTLEAQLQAQLDAKQQELQQLQAQLQNASAQPPAIAQSMQDDYNMKLQSLQLFAQNAEKDIVDKQEELLKPLLAKVEVAIKNVAKANGYAMVFSKTMMNNPVILFADEKSDITNLVLADLGVTPPAESTATGN